jgi:peptidoglycan-associated lipoprotein
MNMKKKLFAFVALSILAACTPTTKKSSTASTTQSFEPGSIADFEKNVGDTVNFDFDKYNLNPSEKARLDNQANWFTSNNTKVKAAVEGHCDERGTREYNLALGERRAKSAQKYLVSKGVDAQRLSVISYGKEKPIAIGTDEASYASNRRAKTTIER